MNLHLQQDLIYFVLYKNSGGLFFKSNFGNLENRLWSVNKNGISEHRLYQINSKIISQMRPKIKLDRDFVNIVINKKFNKEKWKHNGFL